MLPGLIVPDKQEMEWKLGVAASLQDPPLLAPAVVFQVPSAPGPAAVPCPDSVAQRGMDGAQCACALSGAGRLPSLAVTGCCLKPGGAEQEAYACEWKEGVRSWRKDQSATEGNFKSC